MRLVLRATTGPLPTSGFTLMDDDGTVIGNAQLRHRPSHSDDLPPESANHIYYEIQESHRGRGHGRELLGLVLDEARRIGLHSVRLTVDDSNPTSRHIIEAAGGVLIGEFVLPATGEPRRLFEIRLTRPAAP